MSTQKGNLHARLLKPAEKQKTELHRHLTQTLLLSDHLSSALAKTGFVCWHLKVFWCYFGELQRSAAEALILCGEGFQRARIVVKTPPARGGTWMFAACVRGSFRRASASVQLLSRSRQKNNTSEERGASKIINASQSGKHTSQVTQKQQEGVKGGQEEWYL